MLADEDLQPGAEYAGPNDNDPEQQGGKEQLDLQCAAPIAAEVADEVSGAGDREYENAGDEQRGRLHDHVARQVQVYRPPRISRCRDGDEGNNEGAGDATRSPDVDFDAS